MGSKIQVLLLVIMTRMLVIAAETDPNDVAVLNSLKMSWQNLPPNWIGSDPCGSGWDGINCTKSNVTSIVLQGMNVQGTEFGDISSLAALQYLDLSNNRGLKGTFPLSIGNLKNLSSLILVGCSFFGPIRESIGSLQKLVLLSLNNNSFSGPIPASIGYLSKLFPVDLSDNKLIGTIPVSRGNLSGLDMLVNTKHFYFGTNQLSGAIPPQLFSSKMSPVHLDMLMLLSYTLRVLTSIEAISRYSELSFSSKATLIFSSPLDSIEPASRNLGISLHTSRQVMKCKTMFAFIIVAMLNSKTWSYLL